LEKFEFLQNERMTAQAAEVLEQIRKLYPDEPEFEAMEQNFKEQWAKEIVSSRASTAEETEIYEPKPEPPSEADAEMVRMFVQETKTLSKKAKTLAYDMMICLWFMEEFANAVELLPAAPENAATDWLAAELLFASRRYVECLDALNDLEVKYANDPESTFAVSYLRAQAMKKVGQHDKALEILLSIAQVRPNYRSAQRLILEWTGGAGVR
jgi:thioredoxin-like negative regulator of GroEL